ncbi:MAG: hypothetical protein ACOY3N_24725 [Bradyrhizobium sp.]|uniref:hypothetical protein n=1 Tax=Bradyrhizobium TaxID=374 RepID=UPI0012BBC49E|nr:MULTISPECIES: hypothetical protein [Bradyrhizobium]
MLYDALESYAMAWRIGVAIGLAVGIGPVAFGPWAHGGCAANASPGRLTIVITPLPLPSP